MCGEGGDKDNGKPRNPNNDKSYFAQIVLSARKQIAPWYRKIYLQIV